MNMAFKFANEIIDEIKAKELEIPIGSVSGEEFDEWLCTEKEKKMTREEIKHFANCLKNNYTIDFNDMEDFCNAVIESQNKLEKIEDLIDDDGRAEFVYDVGELPKADVVERSEYDKMAKYLKAQIENKENNLKWNRDAFRRVVKRLDRLQRKIDDAYKKMEALRSQSVEECPLSEAGFRCGLDYAMDILVHDVGIGENNNENTK